MNKDRPIQGFVVHTLSGRNIIADEPRKCANCTSCLGVRGVAECIYGGPHHFVEYQHGT